MTQPILSRIGSALVVVFGVSTLVFLLIHLVPGDPVEAMLGESARPADRQTLRAALGLDQPLAEQYLRYLDGLVRLDLGQSFQFQRAVADLLAERIPPTLELTGAALALALALAVPLGVLAARSRGGALDSFATGFSLLGISIPNFWLGPLLILVFSLWLDWTPVSGRDGPASLILPTVTLGTGVAAILARMVRAQVLSLKQRDHVPAARALGAGQGRILLRHLLPLALAPLIVEATFGIAGAVVAEAGLSFLGLGVQPPQASWGRMIQNGVGYMLVAPHLVLAPGVAILLVVLSVNLTGDSLRDRLDVRLPRG
jgi:peptide/nickel transport system permease protein